MQTLRQFVARPSRWCTPAVVIGGGVALLIRVMLLDHESLDYAIYLGRWYDYLRANGGLAGLDELDANYTPAYLYLLAFAATALERFPDIVAIKLVALPFDFVLAAFSYLLVRVKYPVGWMAPLGALAVLFAPTVILNGAYWGQSDAIYSSALVATVYLLVSRRPAWAMIAFGVAIAFKLQAVFIVPLLLALLYSRQLPLRHTLLAPLPTIALALPALALGRSPRASLLAYVDQSSVYDELTMNAPNLYQWVPNEFYDLAYPLGVMATMVATLVFVAASDRQRALLSSERIVLVAATALVFVPFLLPKMHERYFFPADVMAIVLACYTPRLLWVPVVVIGGSLAAYLPFISNTDGVAWEPVPLALVAVFMGVVAAFLVWRTIRAVEPGQGEQAAG